MKMSVFAAIASAPFTHLHTQFANFVRESAISHQRLGTEQTDFQTVAATMRTFVVTLDADHLV